MHAVVDFANWFFPIFRLHSIIIYTKALNAMKTISLCHFRTMEPVQWQHLQSNSLCTMKSCLKSKSPPHRTIPKISLKSVKNFYSIIIQHQSTPPMKLKPLVECYRKCANKVFQTLNANSSTYTRNLYRTHAYFQPKHCINYFHALPAFAMTTTTESMYNVVSITHF